jgi:heat-inducible transcriptional repressor
MVQTELSPRARRILFAVVTEYIETGLPVGSRTLARRHGIDLSAASIRNVLSDLDEAGYLVQPHTSAGRVPTDRAIRLFIDKLVQVRDVPIDERARLEARVAEIYATSDNPLRESGRLLSELSGAAAVVGGRRKSSRTLSQLRFITTRKDQLLAVLVFQDGSVENRFIQVDGAISEPELVRIHNLLTDVIDGRTLGEVRDLFDRRLADDRVALDALRRKAFELGQRAISIEGPAADVVIEGHARLIDLPEYADHQRLKKLVVALEEREEILALLDKTLAAGAVMVFVGAETGELGSGQLSLVVAPYRENGEPAGAVGVLGPTRMDYAKVLPLVDATAAAMSDAIGKK